MCKPKSHVLYNMIDQCIHIQAFRAYRKLTGITADFTYTPERRSPCSSVWTMLMMAKILPVLKPRAKLTRKSDEAYKQENPV
ncbi:hypothetical protein NDU88_003804 [Pleurodeles waltl]|uniref:Uncharacterized protein n=1 Tax=Pleurodeles waltl TaxID=8319 RepID=A0AAV7V1N9_PLEWA|nr:hypothetical protein NDU88_003804 [Pleurodeles waltl]